MIERVKKIRAWLDDRGGLLKMAAPLLEHPVPPRLGWMYVLGSMTLIALVIQIFTGIALATMYIPSVSQAYETLQFLTNEDATGRLLRGMHYWGASAMVLCVGMHMMQVFLAGAYKYPRELNWISGVILLFLILALGFTGQLLRWDQNAVWSVIVGAKQAGKIPVVGDALARFILGGENMGGTTLSRFFSIHVFILPATMILLLSYHLYLVIRNGISEPPKVGRPVDPKKYKEWYHGLLQKEGVPFWPDPAWRDLIACAGVIISVALLAWFLGPPELGSPPDPTLIDADPRPDWYLIWYFALLALTPPALENVVIVAAPAVLGIVLLALPIFFNHGERHPLRRPWSVAIVLLTSLTIGTLWLKGQESHWSPDFDTKPLPASAIGAESGPAFEGARIFHERGCQYCHAIEGYGGKRGPDLSTIGDRLDAAQLNLRILNGANNMPAYASSLSQSDLDFLVNFLLTRKSQ